MNTKDNSRATTGTKHKGDNRPEMDEDRHIIDGNSHVTDGNRHGMDDTHVMGGSRLGTATKHKDGQESSKHGTNGVRIPSGIYEDKHIS